MIECTTQCQVCRYYVQAEQASECPKCERLVCVSCYESHAASHTGVFRVVDREWAPTPHWYVMEGTNTIARCYNEDDAQKVCDALNRSTGDNHGRA